MRIITWNIHSAGKSSRVWQLLLSWHPAIALLQEVREIPDEVRREYEVVSKVAICKTGKPQRFSTAVLVQGSILKENILSSAHDWVNRELAFFQGNIISCVVQPKNWEPMHVVSVYSPAWPITKARLQGIDISAVKLSTKSDLWATEIIWSALINTMKHDETWIIGGDFNSSETFDKEWQRQNGIKSSGLVSSGNKEIRERMGALGLKECLREYTGQLTPTYRHTNGKTVHQLDHLYVSAGLYGKVESCITGDQAEVFTEALSDHLPIVADFKERVGSETNP